MYDVLASPLYSLSPFIRHAAGILTDACRMIYLVTVT